MSKPNQTGHFMCQFVWSKTAQMRHFFSVHLKLSEVQMMLLEKRKKEKWWSWWRRCCCLPTQQRQLAHYSLAYLLHLVKGTHATAAAASANTGSHWVMVHCTDDRQRQCSLFIATGSDDVSSAGAFAAGGLRSQRTHILRLLLLLFSKRNTNGSWAIFGWLIYPTLSLIYSLTAQMSCSNLGKSGCMQSICLFCRQTDSTRWRTQEDGKIID